MNENHQPDQSLSSAEYRTRLLTKLNCLVAVLEVAIAKISRSMDLPGANAERLLKIRSNLENTLSICSRAKQTLERSSIQQTEQASTTTKTKRSLSTREKMSYRDYVELSSIDEYRKFKTLPPITSTDLKDTDFEALAGQLFDD